MICANSTLTWFSTPALMALLLLVAMACTPLVRVDVSSQELERYQTFTIDEALRHGATLMAAAENQGAAIQTPLHFAKAQALWKQAQSPGLDRQHLILAVAGIEKVLTARLSALIQVQSVLREPLALAAELRALPLAPPISVEFGAAEGTLKGLVERAEAGQGAWLGMEPSRLQIQLSELLARARRHGVLGEFESALKELRASDAQRLIPKTLEELRLAVREADDYLTKYPKNKDALAQIRVDLQRQVRRARGRLETVRENSLRARLAYEQLVIAEERRLLKIAEALGETDPGATSDQIAARLFALAQVLSARDGTDFRMKQAQEIAALSASLERLRQEKSTLEAQLKQATPSTAEPPLPPPLVDDAVSPPPPLPSAIKNSAAGVSAR